MDGVLLGTPWTVRKGRGIHRAGEKMDGVLQACSVNAMSHTIALSTALSLRTRDAIREAVDRLAAALPEREDTTVLVDFLEDDLREGLNAIADVEAHFTDVLDLLRGDRVTARKLVDAADDLRALQRLEYLIVVVAQLRRRLSQAAGKLNGR